MKSREPMSNKKVFGLFLGWFLLAALLYALGIWQEWMWISYTFGGIVLVGAVLFLMVNGGIGPLKDKPGEEPRLKIFSLSENTRVFWAQMLLIITLPLILILLGDYCLIMLQTFLL